MNLKKKQIYYVYFKRFRYFFCAAYFSNFLSKFLENFTAVLSTVQNVFLGHYEALKTCCHVGNPWSQPTLPLNSLKPSIRS